MKVKATITPTKITGTTIFLSGAYQTKNGMRILTDNDEVVDWTKDPKDMPKGKGVWLNKAMPSFVLEYEDDEKISQKDALGHIQSMRNKRKAEYFYANHKDFTRNGKPHENSVKHPNFNIEFSTDTLAEKHATFRDTLLVKNRINSMPFEEKAMVAEYFGYSPKGKTELDLLVDLAGDNGLCLTEANRKKFLKEWMNPSADTIMIVNCRKAIRMNIIEERNTAGRIDYYLGTSHLGTKIEDIATYMRANTGVYNEHVLRLVNEEKLTDELKATASFENKIANPPSWTEADLTELRVEAKQLKKDGFIDRLAPVHNMKYENLLPLVEKGRVEKTAKETV